MNTELTAKQIARIERIRTERKEKLRKMNACSWCCNKTPEDQLIATIDGKYMCVPCIDDYNEDHTDTSYDECDGCGKGYLCQYGQGLQPFADQFCPSCEPDVDARDSPNVAPYKKCAFCHERSSCGNYTDDDQWQCESCAPEDNRECCEMCGYKTSRDEWTDYRGNDILYCDDCYEAHRIRIERKCTECRFRQSFPNANLCLYCSDDEAAKDNIHYYCQCVGCGDTPCVKPDDPIDSPMCRSCDKHRLDDEYEPGEREFIEAVKNGDFAEMVRLHRLKKNKLI
jgi:hypothetical protein